MDYKTQILESYCDTKESKARNLMGVSENYYDPIYLIKTCFTKEEVEKMTLKQVRALYKLAEHASDVFY